MGEPLRVQQRQRWPGSGLAVGDPRAVGVVVEPQLHRRDSFPGRNLGRRGSPQHARSAGPSPRGRAAARRPRRVPRRHPDRRHAAHGVRALAARPRARRSPCGGAHVDGRRSRRAGVAGADRPAARARRLARPAPDPGRRTRSATSGSRSRPWSPSRARWPRTWPTGSRSTTSRWQPIVDPRAGEIARALGEARGRRRRCVRPRRPRDPQGDRDPAPGGDADGAARRARRARRRPADGLHVRARARTARASSSRTASAATEESIRVIVPDVGGGFGSKGTLPVETPLVALAAQRAQPPGQVGRGPPRELPRRAAGPRDARRARARVRRRRPHPRPARPPARRPRRLPAAEHADPAAHDRDAAGRLLRHRDVEVYRHRRPHEQGPDRALPRRRPPRGQLPDRDHARPGRPPAAARSRRAAPPQPDPRVPATGPRSAGPTTPATTSAAWTARSS